MKRFVVLCLIFVAGSVHASPITFDFTKDYSTEVAALSDLNNTFTIGLATGGTLTRTSGGLGVDDGSSDDSKVLDGRGTIESLDFLFTQMTRLTRIVFSCVDQKSKNDDFVFKLDGQVELLQPIPLSGELDLDVEGKIFSFGAVGPDDDFRIKSITVDTPIPTPEPATWLLLGSGLVGLIFRRKRN